MSNAEAEVKEQPEQTDLFGQHADRIVSKLDELQKTFVPARKAEEKPAAPAKVRYTAAQLQQGVDEGKISTAAMAEVLHLQNREDLQAEMDAKLNARLAISKAESALEAKAAKLVAEFPDFNDRSSDLWKAAAAEYQELLDEGNEAGPRTQLAAMKLAIKGAGKPAEVKETTAARQRSVETPGASAGRTANKKKSEGVSGWPSFLPEHVVEYYEEAIKKGRYAGRKDPMLIKELEIRERRAKESAA